MKSILKMSRRTASHSLKSEAPARMMSLAIASLLTSSLALAQLPASDEENAHAQWREKMARIEAPAQGCFQANYPNTVWLPASCGTLQTQTHPVRRPTNPDQPQTAGNGNDYALLAPGLITQITGSFPVASGITSESSVGVASFGGGGILGSNEYSLQINTNYSSTTSACSGGASNCTVWQQFIYATDYARKGSGAVFMQYWLINYRTSRGRCPAGYGTSGADCYKNSSYVSAPDVAATALGNLKLTATVVPGGNDTVTFTNGTTAYSVSASDSVLKIGTVWNESEFNIVGDAGGSEAVFNSGTSLTVNLAAHYASTSAPTCASNAGSTGETNNLNLHSCTAAGGATPSIQFAETLP